MVGRTTNNSRGVRWSGSGTTRGRGSISRGGNQRADTARTIDSNLVGQAIADRSSNTGSASGNSNSHVCGFCSSQVGNDAIGCDVCPRWFLVVVIGCPARKTSLSLPGRRRRSRLRWGPVQSGKVKERKSVKPGQVVPIGFAQIVGLDGKGSGKGDWWYGGLSRRRDRDHLGPCPS